MESGDVFLATCSDTGIGAGVFVDEGDDGTVEVDGEVGELGGAVTGGRTEDSRVEIVGGVPEGAAVVTEINDSLREGRLARVAAEARR